MSVEPFHLYRYLDEQTFRFNNRQAMGGDLARFKLAASQVVGKRIMYRELSGRTFDASVN